MEKIAEPLQRGKIFCIIYHYNVVFITRIRHLFAQHHLSQLLLMISGDVRLIQHILDVDKFRYYAFIA